MRIRRVLFPTDFSHDNDAALGFASTLAAEANALLYIVHVDDMQDLNVPMAISGPYGPVTEVFDRSAVSERLRQILPTVEGVQYIHRYLEGDPVDQIVKFAKSEGIDLIVMASHGRTGLARLLMGSIAEGVMRKAHCAVMIVKHPSSRAHLATNSAARTTSPARSDQSNRHERDQPLRVSASK